MKNLSLPALLIPALALLSACASGPQKLSTNPQLDYLEEGKVVQLQYNLHPDDRLHRLYNTNYQLGTLLPRCTPVTLVRFNKKMVTFALESGVQYNWIFEKHVRADRAKHFGEFFVPQCENIQDLSEIDQQGISLGQALVGMTKRGVLFALSLPPDHKTPSLDADLWTYWRNKVVRTTVRFEDGVVVEVK